MMRAEIDNMCNLSLRNQPADCYYSSKSPKRFIFPEYWKQPTVQALQKRPVSPLTPTSPNSCILDSKASSLPAMSTQAQKDLPFIDWSAPSRSKNVGLLPKASEPPIQRRSIIITRSNYCVSHSSPSLRTCGEEFAPKTPPRRIVSGSRLQESSPSLGSCLRESRFSSTSPTIRALSSDSEGSSVRFNMEHVDVVHFTKPKEVYSETGWLEHFR